MNSEFVQQTEALVDQAVLGQQVDDFMRSDVGQYLLGRMNVETASAMDDLKSVDPTNASAVSAAQMKARVPEQMRSWLEQAVSQGLQATKVLEHRQFEDDSSE